MQARYLIIINPNANNGKCKATWQLIKNQLDAGNVNYLFRTTEYHNHARLITEQYIKQFNNDANFNDILLVIGGDGTLNQVINGSKNAVRKLPHLRELPIALIPTGKNNNFALSMNMSLNWSRALNSILTTPQVSQINLGYYYNNFNKRYHYFLNNMGVGFESNLLSARNKNKWQWFSRHFRKIKHFWDILVNLYEIKEFPMYTSIDNRIEYFPKVVWLAIYNTPYFDNNRKLMPHANVNRDSLSVMIMENKNILLVTWAIFLTFLGRQTKLKSVHYFDCKELKISIPSIEYGNIDTEELGGHFYNAKFGVAKFKFIH
ncbi:diacylglycerol/lipid kinase family protein [Lactobacillaceae bacterium Melli_B4]